jgi:hypothetical protein
MFLLVEVWFMKTGMYQKFFIVQLPFFCGKYSMFCKFFQKKHLSPSNTKFPKKSKNLLCFYTLFKQPTNIYE